MRLLCSPTSPYARKVRALIIERGLSDQVVEVAANPFGDAEALQRLNPLGRIPTLVLDDSTALYDSPVICEYLDSLGGGEPLIPAEPLARARVLTRAALADGIMDAAFALVMEGRRPPAERSADWTQRWTDAIARAIAACEAAQRPSDTPDLGDIALAVALGYLDFRLDSVAWRVAAPHLAAWYAAIAQRPSLAATRPPAA